MISESELWYSLGTAFSMGLEGDVQLSGPRSGFPAGGTNLLRYLGKTEQAKIGISAALLAFFMVLPAFFFLMWGHPPVEPHIASPPLTWITLGSRGSPFLHKTQVISGFYV